MVKPVVKNVEWGHTIGKGKARRFFPHRSSADYDPAFFNDAEEERARAKKKGKKAVKKAAKKRAAKKNPSVKVPVGKFIPARLNPDGTVSFLVEKAKRAAKKAKKAVSKKRGKR